MMRKGKRRHLARKVHKAEVALRSMQEACIRLCCATGGWPSSFTVKGEEQDSDSEFQITQTVSLASSPAETTERMGDR